MPMRGWYLVSNGQDMELNGCEPDIALWNPPGGPDAQLEAATKALAGEVAADRERERAEPIPASHRRAKTAGGNGHK